MGLGRNVKGCNCGKCTHKFCASKVPIFSTLSQEELSEINSLKINKEYKKGEILFFEGDQMESLFIINQGSVKVFKYTKEGKEQILYILSEGDIFGELSLFRSERLTFNVEALEDLNACVLTKASFEMILSKRPEISMKVLQVMGERLIKMETLIQSLGTKDIEARIATFLLELIPEYTKSRGHIKEIELPLSREEIANYIGVTRETISRKLGKMQDEGILKIKGIKKIIILDEDALKAYL
ncbi:MAG: transcriptional regulator, Crp/Fnr family [Anaerosolibacter sp.]|uniref:Crp/Fnr family transcriptional regulator n=1 Tax=Anaerosolibacter sp. TaxID=1872527 RepID=UPI002A47D95A|nr:transcriptional regulator, Crp/Fnr family [Anaerosolibacter sp.]